MAGIGIDFESHGEVQISRDLLRFSGRIKDPRPLWRNLYDWFLDLNRKNFAAEGSAQGSGWAPLKPETIAAKRREGYPTKILRRTDDLRDSLTKKGAGHQMLELGLNQLVFGSTLFYAKIHQKGNPAGNLPRRAPMEFKESTRREAVKRTQRFIMTGSPT